MKGILISLFLFCITLQGAIYDCFTFYNELELLKLRFEELYDVVDFFVLAEGETSFTGNPKLLYFAENIQEFEKYNDKIIHLIVKDFSSLTGDKNTDHWNREIHSRDYMMEALKNCQEDDIIFISDVDEIPRATCVVEIEKYLEEMSARRNQNPRRTRKRRPHENDFVCGLSMRLFSLYMNREYPVTWDGGSKAVPFWFLQKNTPWKIKIFHHEHKDIKWFKNAGWHFNGMGGEKRVLQKWQNCQPTVGAEDYLESLERDEQLLKETIKSTRDSLTFRVEIDATYPKYFLDNIAYFRSMGWLDEEE